MKKLTTLLLVIAMVWTISIPSASFASYAVTDDQAVTAEVVKQNPVANYDSETSRNAEPSSENDGSAIVAEPYNAETIDASSEAEQEYRDSVNYVEKRIVFSVHERRKKGNNAQILTSRDAICKDNGLTTISKILETKTDKYGSEAGYEDYEVFYEAKTKSDDVWAVVDSLLATDGVMSAEPDIIWETVAVGDPAPTEEEMTNEWILDNQNATDMWESLDGLPGEDVVVAVIDTGVDYKHDDLKNNMWVNPNEALDGLDNDGNGYVDDLYGINLIANNGDPMDDHGHGTHVAGIIGMTAGNGGGVGLAYGSKIMAVKAANKKGELTNANIAKAIMYAKNNGADVINMSFGGKDKSALIEAALDEAFSSCVLVAAAGNNGKPTTDYQGFISTEREDFYPAGYTNVLGVMATERNNSLAMFSNWDYIIGHNCEYEIAAPGVDIYSTLPGNRYGRWSGTSMATPVVSAAAAILRGQNPDKQALPSKYIMLQLFGATKSVVKANGNEYPLLNIVDSLSGPANPKPRLEITDSYLFDSMRMEISAILPESHMKLR